MSAEPDAEPADGEPAPRSLSAVLDTSDLQQFVDTVRAIDDEARLAFDEDGLTANVVDPANIRMVAASLNSGAFEHLETSGLTIGVSLVKLDDLLDYCDGAAVSLDFDDEKNTLSLACGDFEAQIGLIVTDEVREAPDADDLPAPGPASFTLAASAFDRSIRAPAAFADQLTYTVTEDSVTVSGDGDIDTSRVQYEADDCPEWDVSKSVESMFSIDHLGEIRPVVPDVPVRVAVGDEYPLFVAFETDHLDAEFRVAPRIKTE